MAKVIIILGDEPKDCTIEINGKKVDNCISLNASCDIDLGPKVEYDTINSEHEQKKEEVKFNVKIDDTNKG